MMTMVLVGLVLFAVVAAVAAPFLGWVRVTSVCLILAFAVAPYPLLVPDKESVHFGLTSGEPIPLTFTLFLILLAPFVIRRRPELVALGGGVAFTVILVVLNVAVWGPDSATWAGIIHFFTAAVALAVGVALAPRLRDDLLLRRMITAALLLAVVIQAIFCAAQLLGLNLSVYDEVAYFNYENRPIGTFNHPSVLGKVLFLLLVVMLPLTRLGDKLTTRGAWVAIALIVPLVAVTQARANTVAVLAAIFLWLMFSRRISMKRRLIIAGAFVVASIPFLLVLVPRILRDPEGGDRAVLFETGLEQISREPWWGLGVNSYSQVVGQWDELAAVGLPVHNTFLFLIAELGIFATVVFLLPLALQLVLALRRRNAVGSPGDASRAVWALAPGVFLIMMTGWGILSAGNLSLWLFTMGITVGWMLRTDTGAAEPLSGPQPSTATSAGTPKVPAALDATTG